MNRVIATIRSGPSPSPGGGFGWQPAREADARWERSAGTIAALLAGLSLVFHVLASGAVLLSPQEAYYWQYARHLDLSYFDHPPLAAWTIRATTWVFGNGERAVRLAAAIHGALFAAFFFLAGRRLFGARTALVALVTVLVIPIFALGQIVITPDTPLLSGWVAALYFTVRALDEERGSFLLAAGAAVGWSALGKYTGWLLAPEILVALLLDSRGRRLLRTAWPYAGLCLAIAIFSPVIVWNARHGWASFGFQFAQRGAAMGRFSVGRVGRFLGLQALTVTPIMLVLALVAMVAAARRWAQPSYRLCALFSAPAFAVFLGVSPFMWVKGNWPAPAWPSALLAVSALVLEEGPRARRVIALGLALAAAGTVYFHAALLIPSVPFPARDDVTTGWKELAARVAEERTRTEPPVSVVGCGYKAASELAYYLPGRPETFAQDAMQEDGLQYTYWDDSSALAGHDAILVLDRREPRTCARRAELCDPLVPLEPVVVRRGSNVVTTFDLWRCRLRATVARRATP